MLRFIPNMLTFARFILTIVFLVMILCSGHVANRPALLDTAFIIFVVAGLTDIIDGKVARKLNVTSKFGRMLDPLADKVLVCGAFICFALIGEPHLFSLGPKPMAVIRWSVAAILILRELYVTVLRHVAEAKGINFAATVSGKVKMFLQSFAIGTVVIKAAYVPAAAWGHWFTTVTFIVMVAVTVVSGVLATRRTSWQESVEKS